MDSSFPNLGLKHFLVAEVLQNGDQIGKSLVKSEDIRSGGKRKCERIPSINACATSCTMMSWERHVNTGPPGTLRPLGLPGGAAKYPKRISPAALS